MPLPSVRQDLVVSPRPSGEGVLVYDPQNEVGHVLGPVAAALFAACDGTLDHPDLAGIVGRATKEKNPRLNAELGEIALDELSRAGLFSAPLEPAPAGISRRKLISGLAIGAAGLAVLPLIDSITRSQAAGALPTLSVQNVAATAIKNAAAAVTLTQLNASNPSKVVFWVVTQPLHGTVSVTGSTATYTPNTGYTGPDSFTFTAGECVAAVGQTYPPPSNACPVGEFIPNGVTPATVTITVIDPPTPTPEPEPEPEPEPTAPSFTG